MSKSPKQGRLPVALSFRPADDRLARTAERSPDFDLETVTLARLINFVSKGLANAANGGLKAHGLNHAAYAVLVMLYGSADFTLTPSQLVDATHEKSANITRICDELLKVGLIARSFDANDRRRVQVALTQAGRAVITRVLPDMVQVTQGSFIHLSAKERAQLNHLLRKVIDGQEQLA
ncbi:MAG TPA: MarR family transcriptional regulator [Halothiobacillus sp.]|nr:MarR family transcriptional regulator [Halothiobacillus sp.]